MYKVLTLVSETEFGVDSDHKVPRGPHGYADMNISMNITDMNTMFFSRIISMNISVLLKFHGYEYGYAPNIHGYRRYLGSSLP
jgi:hypothetical protein